MNSQTMLDNKDFINLNDWVKSLIILNKFWSIWFIYYFIQNVIKILASVRLTIQNRKISKIWVIFLHLSPVILLLYRLYQFCTNSDNNNNNNYNYNNRLTGLFISILFSKLCELFYTVTTNISYFNNNNINTLLEIIPVFFSLQYFNGNNLTSLKLDLFYISFNRLLIHLLELFNERDWYLTIDSSVNILTIFLFFYNINYHHSVLTKIRIFPKITSILYCIGSQLLYFVHLSNNDNNIWSLLISHYQTYKEKSFQEFIMDLVIFHATNGLIKPSIYNPYDNQINNSIDHGSYMISGYLNQYKIPPLWEKYNNNSSNNSKDENMTVQSHYSLENAYLSLVVLAQWTLFNIVQKFKQFKPRLLLSCLISSFLSIFRRDNIISNKDNNNNNNISDRSINKIENRKIKDLNKLITKKNYSKFLLRSKSDNSSNNNSLQDSLFLLPDFDTSEDYLPDSPYNITNKNDELYDTESWAATQTDIDSETIPSLHDELWQLLLTFGDESKSKHHNNEELMWQISMWSLLRHQLIEDKRLTRSMYAKESSKELIAEIISEQRFQLDGTQLNDHDELGEIADINDQLICPICCSNPRNVILWPCQCLTVCDDCRLKLGHRAIKNCISCNKHVEGYTKLNFV